MFLVNDFTLGHALRVAQGSREPDVGYPPFDPGDFPRLARARAAAGRRGADSFEAGLEAVLDGLERRFAQPPRRRR